MPPQCWAGRKQQSRDWKAESVTQSPVLDKGLPDRIRAGPFAHHLISAHFGVFPIALQ